MRCSRFVMTCCGVSFCLRPADGFFFFFCLETKEKETKRKIQGWTSPGLLRKGRSGAVKPNSLRFTTLRQGFPTPPVHSSAHAPPPRPFHYTPRRFAVGFLLLVFYSPMRFAVGFGFLLSFSLLLCLVVCFWAWIMAFVLFCFWWFSLFSDFLLLKRLL